MYTRWSKLKQSFSELFIYRTTECKRSKILEHTIQNVGKRITWKKVLKTPIDSSIQLKICWKCTKNTFCTHFIQKYQTFISTSLYPCKQSCSIWFVSSRWKICSLWTGCSTADRYWSFEMFRRCKVILFLKSPKVIRIPR